MVNKERESVDVSLRGDAADRGPGDPSSISGQDLTTGESVELTSPMRMGGGTILLLVLATFGSALAMLVPMAFTLALRVDQINPGDQAALGYIIGVGAVVGLLAAPLTGILSDRTRSRWGRRRPFTVAGAVVGIGGVPLIAFAPDLIWLTVAWVVTSLGWGTAMGSVGNYQADRLPPGQRGKVSAFTGMVTQIAPVIGIIAAGFVAHDPLLTAVIPAAIGAPLIALFVLFAHEESSLELSFAEPLSLRRILRSFVFSPRQFPDFAWNWLGRFIFFAGISLTTTYSTFFYASRLAIDVQDIAPIVAITSMLSIATSSIGAILGGGLSDRIGRRRPFVLAAAVLFATGAGIMAFANVLPVLLVGAGLSSLGVAMFLAVNQAMVLDVLPYRDTQAGRFMAIMSFSQKIPSAIAPLCAPAILSIGIAAGESNYAALYVVAAVLVVAGAGVIGARVRGVR